MSFVLLKGFPAPRIKMYLSLIFANISLLFFILILSDAFRIYCVVMTRSKFLYLFFKIDGHLAQLPLLSRSFFVTS